MENDPPSFQKWDLEAAETYTLSMIQKERNFFGPQLYGLITASYVGPYGSTVNKKVMYLDYQQLTSCHCNQCVNLMFGLDYMSLYY